MSPRVIIAGGGGSGPGAELNYTQITATVNITGLLASSATTLFSPGAIVFDGNPVWVEIFSPEVTTPAAAGDVMDFGLVEAGNVVLIGQAFSPVAAVNVESFSAKTRITPSAGSHTFTIVAWVTATTGTPSVGAGDGGTNHLTPAFVRFTKA